MIGISFTLREEEMCQHYGQVLVEEFPNDIIAKLHVACSCFYSTGAEKKTDDQTLKRVRTVVAVTEHQLQNNKAVMYIAHESFGEDDIRVRLQYVQRCL